jgi:hypothetical protein
MRRHDNDMALEESKEENVKELFEFRMAEQNQTLNKLSIEIKRPSFGRFETILKITLMIIKFMGVLLNCLIKHVGLNQIMSIKELKL